MYRVVREREAGEEEEKHSDDEVSGWEKTRQGEKDKKWANERGRGEEWEECTQIQGTCTHNHGNQALNFNPSCLCCHGELLICSLPPPPTHHPILWPFIEPLDLSCWRSCNYQAVAAAMTSTFTFSLLKVSALKRAFFIPVSFSSPDSSRWRMPSTGGQDHCASIANKTQIHVSFNAMLETLFLRHMNVNH